MKQKITKEELINLYVNENKTDKEIGKIFSLGTFSVWNLRKKFGINGINAQHRKYVDNPQLPITPRQMEIIMGSLLGDCCIKNNNIVMSHTIKNKEYVDWLYEELKSICPTPPRQYTTKGKYVTYWFSSESRKDLGEIKTKIYVPTKRICQWWLDQITPLGLAVWYMDDGSLCYINKSKSVFNFATNSFTQGENHLLSMMLKNKFDIDIEVKPCNKKSGIQYNLVVCDNSFKKFSQIVSPFITSDMKYKIPCDINKEHWINNIECKINKNDLERLYNKERFTQEQIAKFFNVHKSTIRRYMDLFNIKPRNSIEAQIEGINNKCLRNKSGQFLPLVISEEQEKRTQEIFKELRQNSFPYITIKDKEHYIGIIDRLCGLEPLAINNGIISYYSRSGIEICSSHCPQIFHMASIGSLSPVEIFNNDDMLIDCIRRTIKYAKKDTLAAVRQGLKTYRKNRCVTIFPPMWAKTVIKSYSDGRKNLSVLDFSCGFGGRLIGSYASGCVSKYVGIDPLRSNIESHLKIKGIIIQHAALKNIQFDASFMEGGAENSLPKIEEKFDIVITSPPYFNKEQYSNDISQCYKKYSDYSDWKKEWLQKILELSYNKLNPNGYMIIFASNYDKHNVGFDCKDILRNLGNMEPECLMFVLPSLEYLRSKEAKKYDTAWIIKRV